MEQFAKSLLTKLLHAGDKHSAGARVQLPFLNKTNLKQYSKLGIKDIIACEDIFKSAQDIGAIKITRDKFNNEHGLIERIELTDISKLSAFLGLSTLASKVEVAKSAFAAHLDRFPVLVEVLSKWESACNVRKAGPESFNEWLDAITAINAARRRLQNDSISLPIRQFSTKYLKRSKKAETLTPFVDVLLSDSITSHPRTEAHVWHELDIFREEQPVLMAGSVNIKRTRLTAFLDIPYSGFHADAVLSVESNIDKILTIENLTTFHDYAKKFSDKQTLIIYTAGMPSPSWVRMYLRLVQSVDHSVSIEHWGDIDEGGFRIAAFIAQNLKSVGLTLLPHTKMSPSHIQAEDRVEAKESVVSKMVKYCQLAGWNALASEIKEAKITQEQEGI
jgi:hypothetical protein